MLDNIYPISISDSFRAYEFKSIGPNGTIQKVIRYEKSEMGGYYNLGFGDVDLLTGEESDLKVTNNGDSKKVLRTVASTLYTFTNHYPDALVLASGSTKARTRLYRISIATNLEAIQTDFTIWGYYKGEWELLKKGVDYDIFLVERKL
jgi:hypothetical protein